MTDTLTETRKYPVGEYPDMPPPTFSKGIIGWLYHNLFSSVSNAVMTLLAAYFLYLLVPFLLNWAIFDAVFYAESREQCQEISPDGACWAFISRRIGLFIYGFYPEAERWRLKLSFFLMFVALAPVLFDNVPQRSKLFIFSVIYPFLAGWLVVGGFGLAVVTTDLYGGVMLTLIIGVTGIVFSLPIGILLALGRNSHLPVIRAICTAFIEVLRGVPLITLLFVAMVMLGYFLPPGVKFDNLIRVLIMVTLFSSAYIAEVVRGGLAAIPKGQTEAADSLGLTYWQSMRLIVLPQALKISIPGIVNTFIGLYKDTTLVIVIAMFDVLGIGRLSLADAKWSGLAVEVYIFVAIFFFVSCFSMSRYSLYLEKKLHTGH